MSVQTSKRYTLGSAALAFVIWGGWTFYVNRSASPAQQLLSSLVQGTASFIITLIMVRAVTWLYAHLPKNWAQLVLPAIFTVAVTVSCLALIHAMIGTPRIAPTIAPALTVAFLFCLFTAYKLRLAELRTTDPQGGG